MKRKWALAQIDATDDVATNVETSLRFIEQAAADSCSLIAFPEFFLFRGNHEKTRENPIPLDSEPIRSLCRSAQQHGIHLLAGTVPVPSDGGDRFYNTCLYIDDQGTLQGRYRKIHLFDVELDEFTVRESDLLRSGSSVVDLEVDGVHSGLTICYDLRFPELFRDLSTRRVKAVFVPSNFTRETGRAHWEPLLRARAIENQCYVVAPNQIGTNPDTGVASLGQSMVVDPWGQVVARASDRSDWFSVRLDFDYVHRVRRQLPSLDHIELL